MIQGIGRDKEEIKAEVMVMMTIMTIITPVVPIQEEVLAV